MWELSVRVCQPFGRYSCACSLLCSEPRRRAHHPRSLSTIRTRPILDWEILFPTSRRLVIASILCRWWILRTTGVVLPGNIRLGLIPVCLSPLFFLPSFGVLFSGTNVGVWFLYHSLSSRPNYISSRPLKIGPEILLFPGE
jgi:hypothetical protein